MIPNEIKSASQLNRWMYGADLVFIIAYMLVSMQFGGLVHSGLVIPYYIFNCLVAFVLTRQSPYNPQKRIYHTIIFKISRDTGVYMAIPIHRKPVDNIRLEDIYRENHAK